MAYAIEPGTFLNVGSPLGDALRRCGCAELLGEKPVFFEIVLNRPFLGEKKEPWRFAKKRRLALCVICQQELVSVETEAVAGLS